jgi:hypothetical protein
LRCISDHPRVVRLNLPSCNLAENRHLTIDVICQPPIQCGSGQIGAVVFLAVKAIQAGTFAFLYLQKVCGTVFVNDSGKDSRA